MSSSSCERSIDAFLDAVNRRPRLWLSLFALILALQISPWWHPKPDGCLYLSIARSVVHGEQLSALGHPRIVVVPGYPLLISPAFLLGDRPFLWISVLHWLMAVAALIGIYRWSRRLFPSTAVVLTGLATLNLAFGIHYRRTLKEIACLALMVWVTYLLQKLLRVRQTRRTIEWTFTAALLLTCLVMIRYTGIVVICGFAIALGWQVFRRRMSWRRGLVVGLAATLPATLAMWGHIQYEQHLTQVFSGETYVDSFIDRLEPQSSKWLEGVRLQICDIGRISIPGMFKAYGGTGSWLDVNTVVYVAWLVVVVTGWWTLARRRFDILVLTVPFYIALYIPGASDQGARYLVPLTPVIMVCAWCGLRRLLAARQVVLAALLVAHVGVGLVQWIAVDIPRARQADALWPAVDKMATAIGPNRETTGAFNLPRDYRLMLQVSLDRSIEEVDIRRPIAESIDWLVVWRGTSDVPGFVFAHEVGPCLLLQRQQQESAEKLIATATTDDAAGRH